MGIYLSQSNIQQLRQEVEGKGSFQIALVAMQPATFIEVKTAADELYRQLKEYGYSVLLDDRGQRPKNMFKLVELLEIRHRIVISARSLSAGVYEYKDLLMDEFVKVKIADCSEFLQKRVSFAS